jgi:hypothetical protein
LLGAEHLAKERDAESGLRVLVAQGVQERVGALKIAGKTEQLAKESAARGVGRMAFDLVRGYGDRFLETAGLE